MHAATAHHMRTLVPLAAVLAAAWMLVSLGGGKTPHAQSSGLAWLRSGCEAGTTAAATNGPREGRRVALTFDDGPSADTPRILRALRRERAQATFFVIGAQVEGRGGLLRRMLGDGHEIGNHSMFHTVGPDSSDLAQANAAIEEASGFRPCQFRPPGGSVSDELVQRAEALEMGTVLWNVDPGDWVAQEPDSIRQNVVDAIEPGSIVLLHDGGGDRAATAAMAPALIRELRERGFELVTVTKLLGGRFTIGDDAP